MELNKWLVDYGRGGSSELVRRARVSFHAVRLASQGKLRRSAVARRISEATGGLVPVDNMLQPSGQPGDRRSAASSNNPSACGE